MGSDPYSTRVQPPFVRSPRRRARALLVDSARESTQFLVASSKLVASFLLGSRRRLFSSASHLRLGALRESTVDRLPHSFLLRLDPREFALGFGDFLRLASRVLAKLAGDAGAVRADLGVLRVAPRARISASRRCASASRRSSISASGSIATSPSRGRVSTSGLAGSCSRRSAPASNASSAEARTSRRRTSLTSSLARSRRTVAMAASSARPLRRDAVVFRLSSESSLASSASRARLASASRSNASRARRMSSPLVSRRIEGRDARGSADIQGR